MNSKMWLIIAAVVVVGGGVMAVRTVSGPYKIETDVEQTDDISETQAAETASEDGSKKDTRISGMNSDGNKPGLKQTSPRTFKRGKSAGSIDVTPATTTTLQAAALSVMTPETTTSETSKEENLQIADLVHMFKSSTDPDDRIDIADELGMIDNPAGVKRVLELLRDEKDPSVQEALLEALQGLEALDSTSDEVLKAVTDIYKSTDDPDVKSAAQDVLGDVGTPDAAAALRAVSESSADPLEKLNAMENLMRISAVHPEVVSQDEVAQLTTQLRDDYKSGTDAGYRQQAIMALANDGRNNVEFFQQALQTEQDKQIHDLLDRLVRMFTAAPPATPPPGTVVTPVPTPDYM